MAKRYVKDPRDIVKPGDVVRVKVLDVDTARKRISLTLRLDDEVSAGSGRRGPSTGGRGTPDGGRGGADGGRGTSDGGRGTPDSGRGGRSSAATPKGTRKDRGRRSSGAMADALRRAGLSD
jgi:uncharacterized protein